MNKSFLKSSAIIATMTFLSRILGLIRDYFIAKYFGANGQTDAFLVAFRIPNFFRRLFAEGAFSQVFIPILVNTKSKFSNKEVQSVINHIGSKLFVILVIVTIIAIIIAPIITFVFAWGFYFSQKAQFILATNMLKITFPYLLLISLTAFAGAILNAYNKFAIPAFTPVILNISIILSAIYLSQYLETPIMALAWGVLIGGVFQLLLQIPFLIKINKLPKFVIGTHPAIKILKKRILPAMFGVSVSQINLLIDTMIASLLVSGSISWLYYSDRLLEFPLALIGIALATVTLTKLSGYFSNNENKKIIQTINYALKIGFLLAAPACAGLILLAEPLIITLFQYGEFDEFDAKQSAYSLIAYASGLIAFIFIKIIAPVFLAKGDTKTPVKAGVCAMLSNIVLNIILAYFFSHVGLAISTSISAFINAFILYYYFKKQFIFNINSNLLKLFAKVTLASITMIIFILIFTNDTNFYLNANIWQRVTAITSTILLSSTIYFIILWVLNVKINKL